MPEGPNCLASIGELLRRNKSRLWAFGIIVAVSFILYFPSIGNEFVYDDVPLIDDNSQVSSLTNISKAFTSCIWEPHLAGSCYNRTNYYRPLHTLSVMLTKALSDKPYLFHIVNILYYAVFTFLVFLVIKKLFGDDLAAVLGSGFFLIHPIHAEVVVWISAFPESLMGTFSILSLLAYASKKPAGRIISSVFFFLALCSKETAIVVPFVLIVYDLLFEKVKISGAPRPYSRGPSPHASSGETLSILRSGGTATAEDGRSVSSFAEATEDTLIAYSAEAAASAAKAGHPRPYGRGFLRFAEEGKKSLSKIIPHIIAFSVYVALRVSAIGITKQIPYDVGHPSILERISSALSAFSLYVIKVIYPYPLNTLMPINPSMLGAIIGAVLLAILLIGAIWAVRHGKKALGFGSTIFFLFISPALILFLIAGTRDQLTAADRYLAMPLLGAAIIFGYYGAKLYKKAPTYAVIIATLLLFIGGLIAIKNIYIYDAVWHSEESLYQYIHDTNVRRGIVATQTDLSLALIRENQKDVSKAIVLYEGIIKRKDVLVVQASQAANNLGLIYYKEDDIQKAEELFRKSIEILPYNNKAKKNLKMIQNRS